MSKTAIELSCIIEYYGSIWLNYWLMICSVFFIYKEINYDLQLITLGILGCSIIEYSYIERNHYFNQKDAVLMYFFNIFLYFINNFIEIILGILILYYGTDFNWFGYFVISKSCLSILVSIIIFLVVRLSSNYIDNYRYYKNYIRIISGIQCLNNQSLVN